VDLIVERRDGSVVALEVKPTATVVDDDVRHLRWLADRIGDNLLDAAVISTGNEAYRRRDGIGVIPAALLGAQVTDGGGVTIDCADLERIADFWQAAMEFNTRIGNGVSWVSKTDITGCRKSAFLDVENR